MPVPAGYVGFTVLQEADLKTCVNTYAAPPVPAGQPALPPLPPTIQNLFDTARRWWQQNQPGAAPPPPAPLPPPWYANGFSYFLFIIQLNNLNGAQPVPAGHVIVARVSTDATKVQPCGARPRGRKTSYYEKFGQPAIDFQSAITGCDTIYCFKRVVEYGIVPDPVPALAIPNQEHAAVFQPTPAQETAIQAAFTLRLTFNWDYDHCNQPNKNELTFTAETLDPNQGGAVTWTLPTSPITYRP